MPRTYARITMAMWLDLEFRALSHEAQWLYVALLCQPDLSLAGVVTLAPERWSHYAATLNVSDIHNAIRELEGAGYTLVDHETAEVAIRTFLRHDGVLRNRNSMLGAARHFAAILSPWIKDELLATLSEVERTAFLSAIGTAMGTPMGTAMPSPIGTPIGTPMGTPMASPMASEPEPPSSLIPSPIPPPEKRAQSSRATTGRAEEEEGSRSRRLAREALAALARRDLDGAAARGTQIDNPERYLARCFERRSLTDGPLADTLAAEHPDWAADRIANSIEPPATVVPPMYEPEGVGRGVVPDFAALREQARNAGGRAS